MSDRIRLALLVLVLIAFISARAGGALGATSRTERTSTRQAKVVTYARHLLGVRYSYGGSSPRSGFDCSGFTRFVFAHFGVSLPHYSVAQFGLGHVGIYLGGGRFIHAPHSGTAVSVDPMRGWYASRFVGARRML